MHEAFAEGRFFEILQRCIRPIFFDIGAPAQVCLGCQIAVEDACL